MNTKCIDQFLNTSKISENRANLDSYVGLTFAGSIIYTYIYMYIYIYIYVSKESPTGPPGLSDGLAADVLPVDPDPVEFSRLQLSA